ncbi:hypothetical protein SCHPADRAFT_891783 [Schizopora paradoxa]|uniref:F-box domain-containing protein n=1 Tax=Schizopora paradoxa TaxID=27342 RepID=A0A0H2S2I2_9AGAM|nr:hypothetical protein SCHPADRAFT_891783 [Schizopora paradoxa]
MSAPLHHTPSEPAILPPIASLSDDALSVIFDLVFSSGQDAKDDSTTSISPSLSILKLSHVNRQFRLATLSNPKLWTYISGSEGRPEMGLVNACLERSRDLPLTVILNVYVNFLSASGSSCDEVLEAAKPHAHRWRAVHFHFVHVRGLGDYRGFFTILVEVDDLKDISTPALEHLALYNVPVKIELSQNFIAPLNPRALRSLVTVFCFPSKFPPGSLEALTTLEMTFSLRCAEFFDALALIQKEQMPNLTDLSLIFNHHVDFFSPDHRRVPPLRSTSIPSVQRLRITTSTNSQVQRDTYSEGLEKDIFRVLSFPNAQELSITFVGVPNQNFFLFDAVDRIFDIGEEGMVDTNVNPTHFPCISRFLITITPSGLAPEELAAGIVDLPLPLHLLPSLKELCIRSNMILELRTDYEEGREPPALRRIEFDVPQSKSSLSEAPEIWEWVRALADTMTTQGVWNAFEELILTERNYGSKSEWPGVNYVKRIFSRDMMAQVLEKLAAERMAKSHDSFQLLHLVLADD